jgi:hypothetical protein
VSLRHFGFGGATVGAGIVGAHASHVLWVAATATAAVLVAAVLVAQLAPAWRTRVSRLIRRRGG